MKLKMIALALALTALAALPSCEKEEIKPSDTTASSDWRNSIEYEASFYVNRDTKLLYALDRGSITLWDNKGDGSVLQTLEYNSAEAGAIESIEIKDVDLDGNCDIMNLYSESDSGKKYNLWLWNSAESKYKECKQFRSIANPVISEDGKSVFSTEDKGVFGVVEAQYAFEEGAALVEVSKTVANAEKIASDISVAIFGEVPDAAVSKTDGYAAINDEQCAVYALCDGADRRLAYYAHSSDGVWYADIGCYGVYRAVEHKNGAFAAGFYTGKAGELAEICAQLYGCDVGSLTVTGKSMGIVSRLDYSDTGIPILPDPEAEISGINASGYYFERDGESLCHILLAENGTMYCFDPDLTGDSFFHLISTAGETQIAEMTASEYYVTEAEDQESENEEA